MTQKLFSRSTLEFIATAARQKKPEWLDRNRSWYESALQEPLQSLAIEVRQALKTEAVAYRFPTRGLARIRRSGARAATAGWYKDWIGWMATRDSGSRFEDLPSLYFHLSDNEGVFTAGGLYLASAKQVKRMREWIDQGPSELEALLQERAFRARFPEGLGDERKVKTFPRHYPHDHPRIEWLKLTGYYVWRPIPKKIFYSRELAAHVVEDWRQALRLNRVLDRYLERVPSAAAGSRKSGAGKRDSDGSRLDSVQARPFADDWSD